MATAAMVLDKEVNQDRKPTNSVNNIVYFLIAYNDHVEFSLLEYITLISKKVCLNISDYISIMV